MASKTSLLPSGVFLHVLCMPNITCLYKSNANKQENTDPVFEFGAIDYEIIVSIMMYIDRFNNKFMWRHNLNWMPTEQWLGGGILTILFCFIVYIRACGVLRVLSAADDYWTCFVSEQWGETNYKNQFNQYIFIIELVLTKVFHLFCYLTNWWNART